MTGNAEMMGASEAGPGLDEARGSAKDTILIVSLVFGLVVTVTHWLGYAWYLLYAMGAVAVIQLLTNKFAIGNLRGRPLTITLFAFGGLLAALLLVPNPYSARIASDRHFRELVALSRSDPKVFATTVRTLPDALLARLHGENIPAVSEEIDRRFDETTANKNAQDKELERTNAGQIAKLEKDLALTPEWAVYDRRKLFLELSKLAPANERYQAGLINADGRIYAAERNLKTPHNNLQIVNHQWMLRGFGAVYLLDITVKNMGEFTIRDIEVRCRTFGASGTELGINNGIIYQSLRPGVTRRFKEINLGFTHPQSATSRCEIVGAKTGG